MLTNSNTAMRTKVTGCRIFKLSFLKNVFTSGTQDCFKWICMCLWERSRERQTNCNWEVIFTLGFPFLLSLSSAFSTFAPGKRSSRELLRPVRLLIPHHLVGSTLGHILSHTLHPECSGINTVRRRAGDEVFGNRERAKVTIPPFRGDTCRFHSLSLHVLSKFGSDSPRLVLKLLFEGKNNPQNAWKISEASKLSNFFEKRFEKICE